MGSGGESSGAIIAPPTYEIVCIQPYDYSSNRNYWYGFSRKEIQLAKHKTEVVLVIIIPSYGIERDTILSK